MVSLSADKNSDKHLCTFNARAVRGSSSVSQSQSSAVSVLWRHTTTNWNVWESPSRVSVSNFLLGLSICAGETPAILLKIVPTGFVWMKKNQLLFPDNCCDLCGAGASLDFKRVFCQTPPSLSTMPQHVVLVIRLWKEYQVRVQDF